MSQLSRDDNRVAVQGNGFLVTKSITYAAGTTGAVASVDLFTVTGDVLVNIFAVCSDDLTSGGASTIEVGITGNTAALIAQVNSTDIDNGEIWTDATPATVKSLGSYSILTGTNIKQKISTATVTGGTLTYYCYWFPLSSGSSVI